jgi:hypothetical protein
MFYGGIVNVPKNTLSTAPVEVVFPISYGVIRQVIYVPRPGTAGLCHSKVYYHNQQIFPLDPDQDLHGDSVALVWPEWIECFSKPYELVVRAWNDDDTYPHAFDLWISELPKWVCLPYAFTKGLTDLVSLLSPKNIFRAS